VAPAREAVLQVQWGAEAAGPDDVSAM
jgi:hypothetical protein